jgi:biopolymer transport protein ExbD
LIVRAFRKREWASFVVNMTPLIDVVFLIIIFFIMIMSFYEFLPKNVILPNADEAKSNTELKECSITITAEEYVLLGNRKVGVSDLAQIIRAMFPDPRGHTVELRGDKDAPVDMVQKVMQQVAQAGITRIHFATRKPYDREMKDEGSHKSDG